MQYGLAALKSGAISPAQFPLLNADMGGLDFTGAPVAQRTDASPTSVTGPFPLPPAPAGAGAPLL